MPEREYYDNIVNDIESVESRYERPSDKNTYIHTIKMFDEDTGKYINNKIYCYSSGDVGCTIRNAQFGTYYKYFHSQSNDAYLLINNRNPYSSVEKKSTINHVVGSLDEDLYFKIKMPTVVSKSGDKKSVTLFYNNPTHCERHLNIELSRECKQNWNKKRMDRLLVYKHKFLFKDELKSSRNIIEHEGEDVVVK